MSPKCSCIPDRVHGLALMGLSAVVFSVMSLLVHVLREAFSPFTIASARFAINLLAALVAIHASKPKYGIFAPPEQRWLLLGRAVLGSTAMSLVFVAVTQLPLGDANAIIFTNPILTSCLAAVVLKERFTLLEGLAIPMGFIGVLLVVQPTFLFGEPGPDSPASGPLETLFKLPFEASVACAVGSALLAACAYLCVRALASPGRPKVESAVVVGWFAVAGLVIAPAGALITGEGFQAPTSWWEAAALVAVGLLGYLGQWLLNKGLMAEKAGPAAAMRNIDVALSFAYQAALGEGVSWASVCGAFVICAATLLVAWGKIRGGGVLPTAQRLGDTSSDDGDDDDDDDDDGDDGGGDDEVDGGNTTSVEVVGRADGCDGGNRDVGDDDAESIDVLGLAEEGLEAVDSEPPRELELVTARPGPTGDETKRLVRDR